MLSSLTKLFNRKSVQIAALIGCLVIGAVGGLSGIYLAASGASAASLAGLIGGAVSLGIGWSGDVNLDKA